jgi:C-terminal processing protease CtpA/Prc
MGNKELKNIITYYQQIIKDSTSLNEIRNGIIGNSILNRFLVIIDFPGEKLYLRPNKKFNKKFEFDKSGISVLTSGLNFQNLTVHSVLKDSPAGEAGVEVGDKILKINGLPSWLLTLDSVSKMLKKKEGKKTVLKVKRGNQKITFTFRLRKLI